MRSKARSPVRFKRTITAIAVSSCFAAGTALANPTGPAVVHGTAAIHRAGNLLQITNSPNAIINWQSFSIGANEITRFIQQSQASAVLNRVTGAGGRIDPSVILGTLQSNGRVFLINPNGILFGAGAQVDVAGLVASSLNLSNADFLAGKLRFTEVAGAGTVINQGSITTGAGGSVYLVGSAVTNSGIITSPQGEVILAAGNSVELVDPGTPNLRVEIAAADHEARNLGAIISDAGRVGIYAGLINHSGTIRADSAVAEGGRIVLKATRNVTLEDSSVLSAQGQGGGEIYVLGGDSVRVAGRLDASAPNGGDGGFIETSANRFQFSAGATVTTAAPYGKTGTWLIDPNDFTIGSGTGDDITGADLATSLGTTSVVITSDDGQNLGNGDIFVFDSISWTANNSLTLLAKRNIEINSNINGGGDLNFYAGWNGGSTISPVVTSGIGDINSGFNTISTIQGNIHLEAGRDINLMSTIVSAGDGTFFGDRTAQLVAGRNITLDVPDGNTGVFANAPRGGSAAVLLQAKTGTISIQGSEAIATGGDGVEGPGGDATVTLCAGSMAGGVCTGSPAGGISILNSNVEAVGGGGSSGQRGGSAIVTLTAGGSISLDSAALIQAQGGAGDFGGFSNAGGNGGAATVTLTSSSISVAGGSIATAAGGAGGSGGSGATIGANGGAGGSALVSLNGGSISVTNSTINVTGGNGGLGGGGSGSGNAAGMGGVGGNAMIALKGGSISLAGSMNVSGGIGGGGGAADEGAAGGTGGKGGNAALSLSGSSTSLTGNTILVNGGRGGDGGSASFSSGVGGNGGNGGTAAVTLSSGGISVTGSTISVNGGDGGIGGDVSSSGQGGNGGNGAGATVTLSGASIMLASSNLSANGGSGGRGGNASGSSTGSGGNGGNGAGAAVKLTGSSIVLTGSSLFANGGRGGRGGGVSSSSGGNGGDGGNGAGASVTLNAGSISVTGGSINASGGSAGFGGFGGSSGSGNDGAGGAGTVILTANGGNILVQQFSSIRADGAEGGSAVVNLIAPGNITLMGSSITAFGDAGCCGNVANGGDAAIGIAAGGNIVVDGGEGRAWGGNGIVNGGHASITLAAIGSITLTNNVSLSARGGNSDTGAGGMGGNAAVTLAANGGQILIQSSPNTVEAIGGTASGTGSTGGNAAVTMVAASDITIDGSTVIASGGAFNCDCNIPDTGGIGVVSIDPTSGIVELLDGSRVEANGGQGNVTSGVGQINMQFSGRTTGGWFVNGVESDITDGSSGGFFVNGSPAILDTNLIVTYLGQQTFIDNLVASMNQQADVLADQLKAGEVGEEEEKKKLPFCD